MDMEVRHVESFDENQSASMEDSIKVQSHLPTWVLRMREKIATSRSAHADAELRIDDLSKGVDSLGLQLAKMEKTRKIPPVGIATTIAQEHKPDSKSSMKKYPVLYDIPSEVFSYILEYLRIEQMMRLGMVSKAVKIMVAECSLWSQLLPLYCPHLIKWDSNPIKNSRLAMREIQHYLQNVTVLLATLGCVWI